MKNTTTPMNNNNMPSKTNQRFVEVKTFYNKHFPTDRRTYNLRVPLVGLIISILSIQFASSILLRYYFQESYNYLAIYCYIFVASALSYELYYGLKIGDRKQYTPWIIFKFIEIGLIIASIGYGGACCMYRNGALLNLIYGVILAIFDAIVTYLVTMKSVKQFRGQSVKPTDENIYDNYDNV